MLLVRFNVPAAKFIDSDGVPGSFPAHVSTGFVADSAKDAYGKYACKLEVGDTYAGETLHGEVVEKF